MTTLLFERAQEALKLRQLTAAEMEEVSGAGVCGPHCGPGLTSSFDYCPQCENQDACFDMDPECTG